MNLLESIFYGIVSGFSEILPISGSAHRALCLHLFGLTERQPLRDLIIHVAILLALFVSCREQISAINTERHLLQRTHKAGRRRVFGKTFYEYRFLKTATFPLVILLLLHILTGSMANNLPLLGLLLVINGIILIVPEHLRQANKDARELSGMDGILLGVAGALSVFPGISRTGTCLSYCSVRGADRQKAVNWILMLSIPAMILLSALDVFYIATAGFAVGGFLDVVFCFLSGIASFAAAYFAILLIRRILSVSGYDWFAYYSWGAAILSFVLYLIV